MYTEKKNWIIIGCFMCFIGASYSVVQHNFSYLLAALSFLIVITFFCNDSYKLHKVLIITYFISDQILINIGGSAFKAYFFLSILILFFYIKKVPCFFSSNIIRSLLLWIIIGIIFCLVGINPSDGLRTFLGVILQFLTTLVIYLFLETKKINLEQLEKIIFTIIKIGLIFGFIQYIVYLCSGYVIAINQNVALGQLSMGQIPSFRYEGNTYGKLVSWGILFLLPNVMRNNKNKKEYVRWIYISIVMMLISLTRITIYALLIALIAFVLVNIYLKRMSKVINKLMVIGVIIGILVMLFSNDIIQLGSYSNYKLKNFFMNIENAKEDGSGGYRLASMESAIKIWKENTKNFFFGVGYGQAIGDLSSVGGMTSADLGGSDMITLIVSFGIVGFFAYIRILLNMIIKSFINLTRSNDAYISLWIERIIYMSIYILVLESLSGFMLCPEFWMTFGIAAFVLKKRFY